MQPTAEAPPLPRPGMIATVRNRRGLITSVQPWSDTTGGGGTLHLVDVGYGDGFTPAEDTVVWEREPGATLTESGALPAVLNSRPMRPQDLLPVVRACRWQARQPYVDSEGTSLPRNPLTSPFHGAVQVEDYQRVPLAKALAMPRVTMLLADDVGLGKTIEAGLILQELLLRRRIRRVLVLTPASLREQWQDELWSKFSLGFEVVDRAGTDRLRRSLGLEANPWRTFSRVITSYHYLKQPDVLEGFLAASRRKEGRSHLPWDLLIVDEAHNLTPAPLGEESDLAKMLRLVAPLCEHRLFLTATPHNGHTRSFTGLLEMLDPVRFTQTSETMSPAEKKRVSDVVVRRLKRDLNDAAAEAGRQPRFCTRLEPQALALDLSPEELELHRAFQALREKIRGLVIGDGKARRTGGFALQILAKRLLSGPVAFAESWRRARQGLDGDESASDEELAATGRAAEADLADDTETDARLAAAARTVGAWLRPHAEAVTGEAAALDAAVRACGFDPEAKEAPADPRPTHDTRHAALLRLIDDRLRSGDAWLPNERLIVFTEYKTTLDSLVSRLRERFDPASIRFLYGGMERRERLEIQRAFNDPDDSVRVLIATDAASEGLNLQKTARYLLHWDVPWNPARVEQRNGRLDRHGQARDVQT